MTTYRFKEDTDKVLYESDSYYVCILEDKTLCDFYYKTLTTIDGEEIECLGTFENQYMQVGIRWLLEELIKKVAEKS